VEKYCLAKNFDDLKHDHNRIMLPTCGFLSYTNSVKCVVVQGKETRQPPVSYIRLGQELFSSIFKFQTSFILLLEETSVS
jgi:hypothetical protein